MKRGKLLPRLKKIKKGKNKKSILKSKNTDDNPWGNQVLEPQFKGADLDKKFSRKTMMKGKNTSFNNNKSPKVSGMFKPNFNSITAEYSPVWMKRRLSQAFKEGLPSFQNPILEEISEHRREKYA